MAGWHAHNRKEKEIIIVAPMNVKIWVSNNISKKGKIFTLSNMSIIILTIETKQSTKSFNLKLESKKKVFQSSKCKRTSRMITLKGTMDPGFMVSLDLSLSNNGGYQDTT
jgi:hypothetical protein